MDFAEKMCDHIVMIDHGKVVLEGALSAIKQKHAQKDISLNYEGDINFLKGNPIIEKIEDLEILPA